MPSKRRRESSASDGDAEGSLAMSRKKVNVSSGEVGGTTSEGLSVSEGVLASDDPSSSELSSSEDESDAGTDPGAITQTGTTPASSLTGPQHQPNSAAQPAPSQPSQRNGDQLWEILDGDDRTSMALGVEAPKRLKLRFRNFNTAEIREFIYKKGSAAAIRTIDWNNPTTIEDIRNWRNQIFNRLNFPVRKTTRWTDEEVLFLTLVYEKIALAAEQTKRVSLPSYDSVVELFKGEFGDVRERNHIVYRIRRKDRSRLAELKRRVEGELKEGGGSEYKVVIARGELEAYVERRHVRLVFDPAEYERVKKDVPEVGKTVKARKTDERKQKQSSGKPAIKKTNTGRVVKTRKNPRAARVAESEDDSAEGDGESSGSEEQSPVHPDKQGPPGKLLHCFRSARALKKNIGPGGHDDSPEWPHRHLVPAPQISNLRNDPFRFIHKDEDLEVAQKKLVEARNTWLSTIMAPSAPTDPAQPDAQQVEPQDTEDWLDTAFADLHSWIDRLSGVHPLAHPYTGRNEHRAAWYKDADTEDEPRDRVQGAPAVNALLNAAVVPPLGYLGDVRDLVREGGLGGPEEDQVRLPDDQVRLHEKGRETLGVYHEQHDREFAEGEATKDKAGEENKEKEEN